MIRVQTVDSMYAGSCAFAYDDLTRADQSEILEVTSALQQAPDGVVIDAACGSGRLALPIAERTKRPVAAIDTSHELLQLLDERAHNARVSDQIQALHGSILDPGSLPDLAAAYVLGTSTLSLFDKAQRETLLSVAYNALSDDGLLILSVFERPTAGTRVVTKGMSGATYCITNTLNPDGTYLSAISFGKDLGDGACGGQMSCTSVLYPLEADEILAQLTSLGFTIMQTARLDESSAHQLISARKQREK